MKKKLIALLSVLTVAFSLTACNLGTGDMGGENSNPASSNTATDTDTDTSTDTDTDTDTATDTNTDTDGGDGQDTYTYTAFTTAEQSLFNDYFGFVIPFVANNEYYVEDLTADNTDYYDAMIEFYTFGNTQADFNAYKALFSTANGYQNDGTDEDEDGDTWYYYSKNGVYVDISYYTYEGDDVIDVYVYIEKTGSGDSGNGGSGTTDGKDAESILNTLYSLSSGEYAYGPFTLTGTIIDIDSYTNPTIVVEGFEDMPVYCYYLKVSNKVGDIITVTAKKMTNYYGLYEFMECTLVSSQSGSGDSGNGGTETPDFTADEKELFTNYFGFVIPFADSDSYSVEEYKYYWESDDQTEVGIHFQAKGLASEAFDAYKALYSTENGYASRANHTGSTWYYTKNGHNIDVSDYSSKGYIDVYVYDLYDGDLTTSGGSENGVYNVDFTKATNVKDVTDQGNYLGGCPTTGSPKVLVIPVEFSDVTASSKGYTIDKIEQAFKKNGVTDYYSVYDYYYISSYGKLTLDITVVDAWFRPSKTSSYYMSQTVEYDDGSTDEIGDQMILDEALAYLDGEGWDLSQFDADGNDIIDAVVMINTLDIDSDGDSILTWAYRYWNMYTDNRGYYYEYDGVTANDYLWASYRFLYEEGGRYNNTDGMNTYTFIHEFGHVLGSDDYYDYAGKNSPLGGYDVMDEMVGDHNAFTKFNYGWITSSRLVTAEDSVTLTLEAFNKNGDTIIIANNWDDKLGAYQEYYVIMYYKGTGLNDEAKDAGYFSKDGILVYHVNASLVKEDGYYYIANSNSDESYDYGTKDNLIEFVTTSSGKYPFVAGDSLPTSVKDDKGNALAYTFTVDSITEDSATITFTKK